MKRIFGFAAALSAAFVLLGASAASAGPVSGCTNNGDNTQTCNLYETDGNGNPSEISSSASDVFGTDWFNGYWVINDPDSSLSDYVVFYNNETGSSGAANSVYICSLDAGPNSCSFSTAGWTDLGTATENADGFAAFGQHFFFGGGCCDTINISSAEEQVPEPLTLSLFGMGLLGLGALRRRKGA